MAKKMEIIGVALVITDTVNTKTLFDAPASFVYYDVKALEEDSMIKISDINTNGFNKGVCSTISFDFTDAVTSLNQPFTVASIKSFFRQNLG